MAHATLIHEIMQLSDADDWESAKTEWVIKLVYFSKAPATCLCGHYPISELCIVANKKNKNEATVGSCCAKKFMELPANKIFGAVKRVKKKADTSLNEETLTYMYKQQWITQWEYDFYIDTCGKRKLTARQKETRKKINEKILIRMDKNKEMGVTSESPSGEAGGQSEDRATAKND